MLLPVDTTCRLPLRAMQSRRVGVPYLHIRESSVSTTCENRDPIKTAAEREAYYVHANSLSPESGVP
jgi:hypothetical protein